MRSKASAAQLPPVLQARWDELEARIRRHAPLLVDQGTLSSRLASGRRVWSLRFYDAVGDRKVQRSIYIGNDEYLLQRTQELLQSIRRPLALEAELEAMRKLCTVLVRAVRKA